MPEMSLSEAAEWAGVTRPTIHKALKGGKLSGRQDDKRQWHIDPAELERVYPPGNKRHVTGNAELSSSDIGETTAGKGREIALLREMLDEVRRERDDLRQDRDHWREQAETQTRLLTHQKAEAAPAQPPAVIETPAAPPAPHGFRARLAAAGKALAGR